MHFTKLDDSPMFRKQIQSLEEDAESLRERSLKFYKGCRKYTEGLGEAYDGDIGFASALETFGGGHNDPISLAFGGPVMTKFTIALREIGTYKEVLRSQVEHMLNDRLLQFVNIDLLEVKEARKRFDKASDAIQPSNDPLEVPVGPVTRLKAKKFKEAFNGLLQDTWAKVDFKRICNNKEQALINLIHVQEGLVGGTKTITQGLGEED